MLERAVLDVVSILDTALVVVGKVCDLVEGTVGLVLILTVLEVMGR